MSGHSKWSTIKRKKGAEDAKRGKIFTRLARDIVVAAREGGGDENANAKLKIAIAKAKASNMPKENIERAIQRGTGGGDGVDMEELTYEGYGPEGVAYLVDVLTDNKNRTLSDVKRTFSRAGGNFDSVFLTAAEAGADDVVDEEGVIVISTPREMLAAVEKTLADAGYEIDEAELRWEAKNETELGLDKSVQNMKLLEQLEELDDVQAAASNLMITDEVIAALETA
jgi:transcriptional/translational regulatory protein YebC/TACO1